MIVVSDTSPLNYLVLARSESALPSLFGRIVVPPAVLTELMHPRAPQLVRQWAAEPPAWVERRVPATSVPSLKLGPGETEAICVARELRADLILIDERRATRRAQELGLVVVGTLGILIMASRHGLISLRSALDALPPTFRAPEPLLRSLRDEAFRHDQRSERD